jgi:hypothetical protein
VKGSEKKMFSSFRFKAKQSEKTFISFRLEAKRKNRKRNEAKQKNFGHETKRKYGLLISLWLEAKNSKRKEAKFFLFFSRERAKCKRNGSRFALFRFEAKKFLKRNRSTLVWGVHPVPHFWKCDLLLALSRYSNAIIGTRVETNIFVFLFL